MDAILGPVISTLLKMGAPWVITAVFIVLYVLEKRDKADLADKVYKLAIDSNKINTELVLQMRNIEKDVDEIRRRTT